MSANDFMTSFQSLGDNCEFGLVQRRLGYEVLSLFRFASVKVGSLIKVFDARLEGVADPGNVRIDAMPRPRGQADEYAVYNTLYGFRYNTGLYVDEVGLADVARKEKIRLNFYVRKMLEDVEAGDRVFVYKDDGDASEREIGALYRALRSIGPAHLLWVRLADRRHPGGSVERTREGYHRGYIEKFAQYSEAGAGDIDAWLALCGNANQMIFGLARKRPIRTSTQILRAALKCLRHQKYVWAERFLLHLVKADPLRVDYNFHLSNCYRRMGRHDLSLMHISAAHALRPDHPLTTRAVVKELMALSLYKQAEIFLSDLKDKSPEADMLRNRVGRIRQARKVREAMPARRQKVEEAALAG